MAEADALILDCDVVDRVRSWDSELVFSCARDVSSALWFWPSGSSGLPLLPRSPGSLGSVGESCGMGTPLGLISNVGKPGSFIQVPQPMIDLNRPEQPDLTGSSGLPPSPSNTIPLWLPIYQTGNMVPLITVVVSEVHEGFEAVKVANPAGGDVIVVPLPLLLAVVGTDEVAEA